MKESAFKKQQREFGNAMKQQNKTGKPALFGSGAQRKERQKMDIEAKIRYMENNIKQLTEQNHMMLEYIVQMNDRLDELNSYEEMVTQLDSRIKELEVKIIEHELQITKLLKLAEQESALIKKVQDAVKADQYGAPLMAFITEMEISDALFLLTKLLGSINKKV